MPASLFVLMENTRNISGMYVIATLKQYFIQNRRKPAVKVPNSLVFKDNRPVFCDSRSFQDDFSKYSVNSMCFAVRKSFSVKNQRVTFSQNTEQ